MPDDKDVINLRPAVIDNSVRPYEIRYSTAQCVPSIYAPPGNIQWNYYTGGVESAAFSTTVTYTTWAISSHYYAQREPLWDLAEEAERNYQERQKK